MAPVCQWGSSACRQHINCSLFLSQDLESLGIKAQYLAQRFEKDIKGLYQCYEAKNSERATIQRVGTRLRTSCAITTLGFCLSIRTGGTFHVSAPTTFISALCQRIRMQLSFPKPSCHRRASLRGRESICLDCLKFRIVTTRVSGVHWCMTRRPVLPGRRWQRPMRGWTGRPQRRCAAVQPRHALSLELPTSEFIHHLPFHLLYLTSP